MCGCDRDNVEIQHNLPYEADVEVDAEVEVELEIQVKTNVDLDVEGGFGIKFDCTVETEG